MCKKLKDLISIFKNKLHQTNHCTKTIFSKWTKKRRREPFWNYRFFKDEFVNNFNLKKLYKHTIIVIIILLFSDFVTKNLFEKIIEFLYINLKNNHYAKIVFFGFIPTSLALFCISRLRKHFIPSLNSIIIATIYITIYYFLIRNESDTTFLPIESTIKFIDVTVLALIIHLSKWSLFYKRDNIEDKSHQFLTEKKDDPDLFGYSGLSCEIEKFIHNTETEHSFAIGVLGNWGDGKSFLTNTLLEELKKHKDDYIVLDFNPWQYDKDQLIGSFFNEFINTVSSIDKSLKNDFASYASKITDQSNNENIQLTNFFIKILTDSRTINEIKSSISDKLKYSRKKVVIFIDDTDRLDLEEIQSVLKIIRNSANFSNTFFIAGVDYNYLHSKIEDPKYLEKIFNVLVALPKSSPSSFKNKIIDRFKDNFSEQQELIKALEELLRQEWFMSFLKNLRQVNRLINSFKITYNKIGENVDLKDLIILETIKNSETKIYFELFNNKITKQNFVYFDNIEVAKKSGQIEELNNPNIQRALQYLFNKQSKHLRTFASEYQLMFFNYSYKGINISEFYDTLAKSKEEMVKQFNFWIAENETNKNELLQLLTLYLKNSEWKDTFEKFVPVLLELKDESIATRIFKDIYLPEFHEPEFNNELLKYFEHLLTIISKYTTLNPILALEFTFTIVGYILQIRDTLDDYKLIISNIYRESLSELLETKYSFDKKYKGFQKCIIGRRNQKSEYDPECIRIFKEFVLQDENNLIDLLDALVKPDLSDEYDESTCSIMILDFLTIIFNDKKELLTKIENITLPWATSLTRFFINNIDHYYAYREQIGSNFSISIDQTLYNELLQISNRIKTKNLAAETFNEGY